MSLLGKIFGKESKAQKLESLGEQFDAGRKEFLRILINGLSDEDQAERENCARIIKERVIPALELDKGAASKAASLATIQTLISELRPPKNESELNDLNNAAFHYMRLQLSQRE